METQTPIADPVGTSTPGNKDPLFPELTRRQAQVAHGIIRGLNGREIAGALNIGLKTYDTHRGAVLEVLGCENTVQLLLLALKRGHVQS